MKTLAEGASTIRTASHDPSHSTMLIVKPVLQSRVYSLGIRSESREVQMLRPTQSGCDRFSTSALSKEERRLYCSYHHLRHSRLSPHHHGHTETSIFTACRLIAFEYTSGGRNCYRYDQWGNRSLRVVMFIRQHISFVSVLMAQDVLFEHKQSPASRPKCVGVLVMSRVFALRQFWWSDRVIINANQTCTDRSFSSSDARSVIRTNRSTSTVLTKRV